jgi:nucleotide-binding universal stress UspA family protein
MKAIVALDDSPMSAKLVESIISRQWPEHTEFKILTILEPFCLAEEIEEFSKSLTKIYEKRLEQATKHCQQVREKLESKLPGVKVHMDIRQGSAPAQIVDAAVEWSADKILMGAHSRDICPHNLLGSVSRRVSGHSPCSVEIVRTKELVHKPRQQTVAPKRKH